MKKLTATSRKKTGIPKRRNSRPPTPIHREELEPIPAVVKDQIIRNWLVEQYRHRHPEYQYATRSDNVPEVGGTYFVKDGMVHLGGGIAVSNLRSAINTWEKSDYTAGRSMVLYFWKVDPSLRAALSGISNETKEDGDADPRKN